MTATKTKNASAMDSLYRRVGAAGFKRPFVQQVALPSWWDDSLADSETGFAHGALLIARHLGVEVGSLLEPDSAVALGQMGEVCFKASVVAEILRPSTSVAMSAARLLSPAAAHLPGFQETLTAPLLRDKLSAYGPAVTLDTVLSWCWDNGIPVLHLKNLPGRKPQALCLRYKARPYIFLCDGHNLSAWQAFHLLHELGHICRGHLDEENSLRVDEKIERSDTQAQEAEANAFAVETLLGTAEARFLAPERFTVEQLAAAARIHGAEQHLDPGAVVLNVFYHDTESKRIGRNMKAAQRLEPDVAALTRIQTEAEGRLRWDALSDDDTEYLRQLAGMEDAAEERRPK